MRRPGCGRATPMPPRQGSSGLGPGATGRCGPATASAGPGRARKEAIARDSKAPIRASNAIATTEKDLDRLAAHRWAHRLPVRDDLTGDVDGREARPAPAKRPVERPSAGVRRAARETIRGRSAHRASPSSRIATRRSSTGPSEPASRAASARSRCHGSELWSHPARYE